MRPPACANPSLAPFKFFEDPVHDAGIPVIPAQMGVTVGRLDLKNALANLQNRYVKGAATQIVDGDFGVLL